MNFLKERVRARRILRWRRQIDACSDKITTLSIRLANMDVVAEWELAEAIRDERALTWERRNALYTRIKEST